MECLEYFDSKNMGSYACEIKRYIVATIIKKHATKFC